VAAPTRRWSFCEEQGGPGGEGAPGQPPLYAEHGTITSTFCSVPAGFPTARNAASVECQHLHVSSLGGHVPVDEGAGDHPPSFVPPRPGVQADIPFSCPM
jgi:hypothetical protein